MKKSCGRLSHLDGHDIPRMVDVSDKPDSMRTARAIGFIRLAPGTLKLINGNKIRKGNVLRTAELAGIMAAKRTYEIIPLCHGLNLAKVEVSVEEAVLEDGSGQGLVARSYVSCTGRTGVEMEALHAVSVALLTVYDMCKAVDRSMEISNVRLVEKTKTELRGR